MENLYKFYKKTCEKYPENFFCNHKTKYTEVLPLIQKRAAFLQKEGYQKGDVIAILAGNSPDWGITYMAITAIGAISLNLDTNLTQEIHQDMLDHVDTKAVFFSSDYNFIFKNQKTYKIGLDKNIELESNFQEVAIEEDAISTLLFTSGTTGDPKVIPLTHKNIIQTSLVTNILIFAIQIQ